MALYGGGKVMSGLILSDKYKDFLRYDKAKVEVLEGTTAA